MVVCMILCGGRQIHWGRHSFLRLIQAQVFYYMWTQIKSMIRSISSNQNVVSAQNYRSGGDDYFRGLVIFCLPLERKTLVNLSKEVYQCL